MIRNGAKTISLPTLFGRFNDKKRSKNNKLPTLFGRFNDKKRSKNNKSTNVVWEI